MSGNTGMDSRRPSGLRMRYLMLIDFASILLAISLAFAIRYEALTDLLPYIHVNLILYASIPLVRILTYYKFNLYRRLWLYSGVTDLRVIILAGLVSFVSIYLLNFGVWPLLHVPYCRSHSVIILEGILSLAFLAGTRFLLRLLQERIMSRRAKRVVGWVRNPSRILVAGAGHAGETILRDVQHNRNLGITVVGFVDDDPAKLRMRMHDVPVLGARADIPSLVTRHRIDEVIIAMPKAPGQDIREIKRICDQARVRSRVLPGVSELIDGTVSVNQLREVRIEDLLRRAPVHTDTQGVNALLQGQRVLVTGAGGSIGSELCRQILRCQPAELILLGHGENSLFDISNKLHRLFPAGSLSLVVADIRDRSRLATLFSRCRPEVVFHAAAHKHVPMMESNPEEAVTNNVLGTRNLVELALAHDVRHFVMISSDKAVNPTSVMGVTKRIAELLVCTAAQRSGGRFVAVRFGNVLGSRGSVVPLFKEQIARGGPVTVTHPAVCRYFMTIPEAVELLLQAAALGQGGEIFVLDMGQPIKIVDLAHDLIALSGLVEGSDIEIEFTGLRPGEKLFEELFKGTEDHVRTQHERIFVCRNGRGSSCAAPTAPQWQQDLEALIMAAQSGDEAKTRSLLHQLVPEYQQPSSEAPDSIQS